MRICLLSPGAAAPGEAAAIARHAALLGGRHEVVVLEPGPEVEGLVLAGSAHERSAAAMEAIRAYYGEEGPDYLEVRDSSALGFVPLQARATGDPVLAATAVGLRVAGGEELRSLHNAVLSQTEHLLRAGLGRYQLRHADHLLWPGGGTLELYRRYFGELGVELPEPLLCRSAAAPAGPAPVGAAPSAGEPLRILCLGPLERARGSIDLVEACLSLPSDDWELTLAGEDTATATMGQSLRASVEAMAGGDPRVRLQDPPGEVPSGEWLAGFDLLAVPARTEAWSEEVLAAMGAGLPVLATPVGGLVEQVEDGVTGWLTADFGAEPLRLALAGLLADRDGVERLRGAAAIAARRAELTDPEPIFVAYEQLAVRAQRRPAPIRVSERPLVTGLIPYYGAAPYITEAVDSLLEQTYSPLEVIVVNDGSFGPGDAVLDGLAERDRVTVVTQANSGESSARNFGIVLARGEYVAILDADNAFEPTFVERAVTAFERDPELAYVTSWLRFVDAEGVGFDPPSGYAALGNGVPETDERNWDGDTIAVLPRGLFTEDGYHYGPEGSMHSDWELYRWLRQEGRYGTVIPERLARYRILGDSLLRAHGAGIRIYGWDESRDRNRQRRMRWITHPR
ncbi:MAG: glycogen synthase [Solirubrobacterales bacterium]|nr:glycogen synthase [Solirubrobacterales bacterium]